MHIHILRYLSIQLFSYPYIPINGYTAIWTYSYVYIPISSYPYKQLYSYSHIGIYRYTNMQINSYTEKHLSSYIAIPIGATGLRGLPTEKPFLTCRDNLRFFVLSCASCVFVRTFLASSSAPTKTDLPGTRPFPAGTAESGKEKGRNSLFL